MGGHLIVFEGIDGCGKSTQAKWLASQLADHGIPALYDYEPTQNFVGQHIRRILRHEIPTPDLKKMAILFAVDRYMHCQEMWKLLDAGVTVVLDRYIFSTLAYNCETMDDMNFVIDLHKDFYIVPDVVIWLYIDPREALKRKGSNPAELFETVEFLERVENIYASMFHAPYVHPFNQLFHQAREVKTLICSIGAFHPIETIQHQIWQWVRPLFKTINDHFDDTHPQQLRGEL